MNLPGAFFVFGIAVVGAGLLLRRARLILAS
jgi:hypothetical protein